MWVVEIHILGRRFTFELGDHRRDLRLTARTVQGRLAQLRNARFVA
jgi:cell division protein ZapA (FtsZ GTPase activity inhibitor)